MSNLKIVSDDDEFNAFLKGAGDDLVVIDFYTSWCRPCKSMEPVFEAMALHYPKAIFLKVDADKCFSTAMTYKVSGVPFFVIYFNKTVVETIQGANPQELELKIRLAEIECRKASAAIEQSCNFATNLNPVMSTFGKLGSVMPYIDQENSHCLNDLSPTSFHNFLGGKKLISGKGSGKILIVYSFTQKMMLQSFKVKASPATGPKVLRFFVNHPKVLDFNVGSTLAPSQEVTLSHHDLLGDRAIELRSGSFQVVTNLQVFVVTGQGKSSKIEMDSFQLFGAPVLAVQPLLTAAESNNGSIVLPSERSSRIGKGNKSGCPSTETCSSTAVNQSDEDSGTQSPVLAPQCKSPSSHREDRNSQHFRRNSIGNENNNVQVPGFSKNIVPLVHNQQINRETEKGPQRERQIKDRRQNQAVSNVHHYRYQ